METVVLECPQMEEAIWQATLILRVLMEPPLNALVPPLSHLFSPSSHIRRALFPRVFFPPGFAIGIENGEGEAEPFLERSWPCSVLGVSTPVQVWDEDSHAWPCPQGALISADQCVWNDG